LRKRRSRENQESKKRNTEIQGQKVPKLQTVEKENAKQTHSI
jgi:hypothetical protein